MSDNITNSSTPTDANPQVSLDRTRSTAVVIRRSTGHQQEPLLLLLVSEAWKLRGENEDTHIRLYTQDGAPAEQEQTTALLDDITNGVISSIIVERPDRLMRSEHTLTTKLLQEQQIIVVVPGERVYDFGKEEDVNAFQMDTQEAYAFIARHIKYMKASRKQKRQKRD